MGINPILLWLFLLCSCQKADFIFCDGDILQYNEAISQNHSLFCTTGDQGEKGSRGMTGQWIVFLE